MVGLDAEDYPAWSVDEALAFLPDQRGLSARLPGVMVEQHGDLFFGGQTPSSPATSFHRPASRTSMLTQTLAGYLYLMTDVLFRPVADRASPEAGPHNLSDGNFLTFAIACRWISELQYVYNKGGGSDLLRFQWRTSTCSQPMSSSKQYTSRTSNGRWEARTPR